MPTLTLPMPPSVNELHTNGNGRRFRSKAYMDWLKQAEGMFLTQKRTYGQPVDGHFTYHVILDETKRGLGVQGDRYAKDGSNYDSKALLDFLQHVGVIKNDKYADAGSWSWGPVAGCFVRVYSKGGREDGVGSNDESGHVRNMDRG